MGKAILDFKVIENKKLNKDFFILNLSSEQQLPELLPGQFVQVRIDGSPETFLRRPISIHDVDYRKNSIELLIQVAGKGTSLLSHLQAGDNLNLIFPLGNSFSLPAQKDKILLIGGGCGVAPLLYLAKYLKSRDFIFDILIGFRNSERIIEYDEYEKLAPLYLSTEDGSSGEKGFVTRHSVLEKKEYRTIYCCGPDSMMKAVAVYANSVSATCEVSLENLMACGFGVCLCCVVQTTTGNLCTCTDGPVFNIKDLKW